MEFEDVTANDEEEIGQQAPLSSRYAATQAHKNAQVRASIKNLFGGDELRGQAVIDLKESWGFDLPSFRDEELQEFSADICSLRAAKRDGQKEIITWLQKL